MRLPSKQRRWSWSCQLVRSVNHCQDDKHRLHQVSGNLLVLRSQLSRLINLQRTNPRIRRSATSALRTWSTATRASSPLTCCFCLHLWLPWEWWPVVTICQWSGWVVVIVVMIGIISLSFMTPTITSLSRNNRIRGEMFLMNNVGDVRRKLWAGHMRLILTSVFSVLWIIKDRCWIQTEIHC